MALTPYWDRSTGRREASTQHVLVVLVVAAPGSITRVDEGGYLPDEPVRGGHAEPNHHRPVLGHFGVEGDVLAGLRPRQVADVQGEHAAGREGPRHPHQCRLEGLLVRQVVEDVAHRHVGVGGRERVVGHTSLRTSSASGAVWRASLSSPARRRWR